MKKLEEINRFSRLLSLDDTTFSKFLNILDLSQGNMLRQFSYACHAIVIALVNGNVKELTEFAIEKVGIDDIISSPKGSESLLRKVTG
jgi:hypothetical protein